MASAPPDSLILEASGEAFAVRAVRIVETPPSSRSGRDRAPPRIIAEIEDPSILRLLSGEMLGPTAEPAELLIRAGSSSGGKLSAMARLTHMFKSGSKVELGLEVTGTGYP